MAPSWATDTYSTVTQRRQKSRPLAHAHQLFLIRSPRQIFNRRRVRLAGRYDVACLHLPHLPPRHTARHVLGERSLGGASRRRRARTFMEKSSQPTAKYLPQPRHVTPAAAAAPPHLPLGLIRATLSFWWLPTSMACTGLTSSQSQNTTKPSVVLVTSSFSLSRRCVMDVKPVTAWAEIGMGVWYGFEREVLCDFGTDKNQCSRALQHLPPYSNGNCSACSP